jgi:hypothetical protein
MTDFVRTGSDHLLRSRSSLLPSPEARAKRRRRRTFKDAVSRWGITIAGFGVVFSLGLIFAYLLYEVLPVLRGAKITPVTEYAMPRQADGAVVLGCGESVVLVTAVASSDIREGIDFFPLTVDIEEKVYAVGKIPGSVLRREGRPSEKATLTARLTDRPLRPSFPDWFRHDTQVIATVLQADDEHPWDAHCITAASCALMLGGIPFAGPISGVRMAHNHH